MGDALASRGRRANPVLTYETALRRFFAYGGVLRRGGNMMMADDVDAQSDDYGGRWGEATAEGRLYNCSPRLACLPGVGC